MHVEKYIHIYIFRIIYNKLNIIIQKIHHRWRNYNERVDKFPKYFKLGRIYIMCVS